MSNNIDLAEFEVFCLYSKMERLNLLKKIAENKAPLRLSTSDGASYMALCLNVSDLALVLEAPQDLPQRDLFLQAQNVLAQTELNKISIEFRLEKMSLAGSGNSLAFRAHLPDKILRLQRRETFRVDMQNANDAFCQFVYREKKCNFPLKNLSIGGMALMGNVAPDFLSAGEKIEKAQLFLPQTLPLNVDFVIKKIHENKVDMPHKTILGCAFLKMSGQTEAQISRCITQIERNILRK